MSGYAHDELVGTPISTLEAVESPAEIAAYIRKLIESVGHERFESKHRRKDGSVFDVDITALHLEREGQVAISTRDTTARKQAEKALQASVAERERAEEALRESRRRYQALVETNVDFIWETDAQGRYTYCSPQMETLWGLRPEDMIGKTPFDVMPEEERDAALRAFLGLARSPAPFRGLESSALDARGRPIFVETSGVPLRDDVGAFLGFRGTTRGITDRRRAEEALRGANSRLVEADRRKNQFLATLSHELRNPLAPVKNSLFVLGHVPPGSDEARRARDVIERQVDQLSHLVDDLLDITRITSGKIQLQRRRLELRARAADPRGPPHAPGAGGAGRGVRAGAAAGPRGAPRHAPRGAHRVCAPRRPATRRPPSARFDHESRSGQVRMSALSRKNRAAGAAVG